MNLEIESFGPTKVIRIKEKVLSFPLLSDFFEKAYSLIDGGIRDLVINLSEVEYLDSASLGCLMDISRNMSKHNGTVKLVGLRGRVETMATMVGLTHHIETYKEEKQAISQPGFRPFRPLLLGTES
jgi:anti-anti-sigma factor